MQPKDILGLDVGLVHTGVARASNIAMLAEPLSSFETANVIEELQKRINQVPTGAVVVGLPRNLDSKETKQTAWVRQWVALAKQQIKLPFYWQDEALTSHQAAKTTYNGADEHSKAAAIILQDFLDTPEDERVEV